jgi:hypothetical protein
MGPQGTDKPIPVCTCVKDAFASLPPELRPRPQKSSSLRQVTCPGCGLVYLTNRATDLCMECEKKGVKAPAGQG